VELPPITVEASGMAPVPDQPPAVTTITPEELEAAGVDNTRDLSALAPNLVVQEAGDRKCSFIGMRGRTNAAAFSDSNVGLYVDGVPYVDPRGALIDLYDVESVPVFRGPQTSTFGRNAESGVSLSASYARS
jgi:outer membrane receptor protein involved in Fe transport